MLSRQNKAIAICLLSAAILGYFAIFRGRSAVATLIELFIVWHFVASWLGNQFWLLGLKPREIHREARRGGLRLARPGCCGYCNELTGYNATVNLRRVPHLCQSTLRPSHLKCGNRPAAARGSN